jgi:hypothetical protein
MAVIAEAPVELALEAGRAALADWAEVDEDISLVDLGSALDDRLEILPLAAWEIVALDDVALMGPQTRLQSASDELFWALEGMGRLPQHIYDDDFTVGDESALDELINCAFNPREEPLVQIGVDPDRLAAARARLHAAGLEWARAVVDEEDGSAGAVTCRRPRPRCGGGAAIDRRRLDVALDRIGHQGSPVFRRRLATAYDKTTDKAWRRACKRLHALHAAGPRTELTAGHHSDAILEVAR